MGSELEKIESKKTENEKSLINGPNLVSEKEYEDFIEQLIEAPLDHSSYEKESFSIDVEDRSLTVDLDSRTNPFEEWGNDTYLPLDLRRLCLEKGLVRFLHLPVRSFRDFCSLVYSGGLSRDLDVNSVEIKDSSASCHQEIKLLISPVKIQDWCFLRLTEEQGFLIPKFADWLYGSRSS
ncbi:hypothetical protein GQ457_02G026970 [Hibiscus cannabinus]